MRTGIWEIMASEAHNVKKQKVLLIEGHPIDLPRKRISSSTKKIMKEVSSLCCSLSCFMSSEKSEDLNNFIVLSSLNLEAQHY